MSRRPELDPAALYGLTGEVVRTIAPESEADPAAILLTFLTCFGNAVGAGPHARAGGARHPARLFTLIVGDTARSRKGTSWADTRPVLAAADPAWTERVVSGFGSGEAVIETVRDPAGDEPGSDDRRALIREGEFVCILRVARRDGSTLGAIIRDGWDGEQLASRTIGKGVKVATGAHLSVLAHVTREELERELLDVDVANGFANRFVIGCAWRSQRLPSGGCLDDEVVASLSAKVRERLLDARRIGIMRRTPEAEDVWTDWYNAVNDEVHGMYGAVTARAEAQVLRLSVAYALTDASRVIEVHHLVAALGLWRYCDDSARFLFASTTGNSTADRLLERLVAVAPAGLDGTQQNDMFGGHRSAAQLATARALLADLGLAETTTDEGTGGRPRIVTFANDCGESGLADKVTRSSEVSRLSPLNPQTEGQHA
jgi:hypothetical protein